MAALFLLALALIAWQAVRTKPLEPDALAFSWTGGEQVFPITAPLWAEPAALPAAPTERHEALRERSVPWPGRWPAVAGACEIFIRTSSAAWVRRGVDPALLPADRGALRYAANDFLDDEDGDGDALDAGELTSGGGSGAEVETFCPPPVPGEARP